MPGITHFGVYLPKRRLQREAIAAAHVWFDASLKAHARGERTMCNWDEDVVTMAVEAARDMVDRPEPEVLTLASTTLPFADRQNAGIVMEALNLGPQIRTRDICGSLRAGTTALLDAFETSRSSLVLAADNRHARAGSAAEMLFGDGAVALSVGEHPGIARYLAGVTVSADFVDHFRGADERYDYEWEERWVREEGYLKLIPDAVKRLYTLTGLTGADIGHLIVPVTQARVAPSVAKAVGVGETALADTLASGCGHTGVAHPLLMLAAVLEKAKPGERIVLTGFGQGCDAVALEVTRDIHQHRCVRGLQGSLDNGVVESNYAKFQTFTGLVEREFGKRAEVDRSPALSAHNRNRGSVNGFIGGRCSECGTVQFPKSFYCVNPNCGKPDTQEDCPMSQTGAAVKTYTADRLTFDLNPPAYFGMIEFDGGGRAMMDFTEVEPDDFDVGRAVRLCFRVKHMDARRGYKTYFWKAAPV